jgi:hypothetical protein
MNIQYGVRGNHTEPGGGMGPVPGFWIRSREFIWPSVASAGGAALSSWLTLDERGWSGEGQGLLLALEVKVEAAQHSPPGYGFMRAPWRGDFFPGKG